MVLSHISEFVGGAERSVIEVLDIWVREYGVVPEFILREPVGTLGPELDRRKWKYHSLPYGFWSESTPPLTAESQYKKALQNSQAVLAIEKIIKKSKPDIVITNSVVCPWAALAAYYQQVPHVWFVREYGDLDHGRTFDMSRQKTFEDVDVLSQLVVANSRALTKHLAQYMPSQKLATLYHPFDVEKMRKSAQEKVTNPFTSKDSLKLVLPAGSVTASKGFLEAVKATGELNKRGYDVELCIIGNTHEKEFVSSLRKIIADFKIDRKVHFIGFQKNLMPYVLLADIGIMASRMEAFGRVTFEYMVLGKPVVGVGAGGTPEMVKDDYNGFLYEYRNLDGLIAALEHYAEDRQLALKHGKNSLKQVDKMMQSQYNVHALYDRVQEITSSQPPGYSRPLHYSHTWLQYPALADAWAREAAGTSVKKLLVKNSKARVRYVAHKAKAAYRRRFR